jgi:hypothetical protein
LKIVTSRPTIRPAGGEDPHDRAGLAPRQTAGRPMVDGRHQLVVHDVEVEVQPEPLQVGTGEPLDSDPRGHIGTGLGRARRGGDDNRCHQAPICLIPNHSTPRPRQTRMNRPEGNSIEEVLLCGQVRGSNGCDSHDGRGRSPTQLVGGQRLTRTPHRRPPPPPAHHPARQSPAL